MATDFRAPTAVTASGQTVGAAFDLDGRLACGIITPAAVTATSLTFQTSYDGTTYAALVDDSGNAVTLTGVVASKDISLGNLIGHFYGVRYLKLVSSSAEAADRTFRLRTRPAA